MNRFFDDRKMFLKHKNSFTMLKTLVRLSGNKYMAMLTYFSLTVTVGVFIWQIYLLYRTEQEHKLLQYSPLLLINIIGILTLLQPIVYGKKQQFFNELIEESFYSVAMAETETGQRILRESKQIERLFCFNILLMLTVCFTYVKKEENEPEDFLCAAYLKETFPEYVNFFQFIWFVMYMVPGFYLAFQLYSLIYLSVQQLFQFYILNDCVSRMLGRRYKFCVELELPYDELYQKKVFKGLKFCIKYHEMLMRNGKIMVSSTNKFIGLYIVVFYMFWVYTLANILWSPVVNYPRVVAEATTLTYIGSINAEIAQRILEESLNIHQAFADLPWHTWNMRNKKILLHTLIHAGRGLKMGPIQVLALDRTLLTQVIKFIWSVSAVMVKVRDVEM